MRKDDLAQVLEELASIVQEAADIKGTAVLYTLARKVSQRAEVLRSESEQEELALLKIEDDLLDPWGDS